MACSIDITLTNLIFLGALVFVVKKLIKMFQKYRLEKMLAKWENTPKDKVILHGLWRCRTVPSLSPYALKLETFLRMSKIPYELETKDMIGPKGKMPWITFNGTHVPDSHFCIKFLNKKMDVNLNKKATEEQVAAARAVRIMLEDHFSWGMVNFRVIENSTNMSDLTKMPLFMKLLFPLNIPTIKKRLDEVGMGKHTRTEIYDMCDEDLRTCSKILGNQKFFGGEGPCEEDAAIFGFLANVVWAMPGSSFEKLVEGDLINLKQYCERMKELYWKDWEECLDK